MNAEDLDLIPASTLLEALKKRFDHTIFSGLKVIGTERNDEELRSWSGHALTCVGLASGLIHDIHIFERSDEESDIQP